MNTPRIVITGAGILGSVGRSFADVRAGFAVPTAVAGINDSSFHSFGNPPNCFGVADYDPQVVLGKAGLRTKDRATKLLLGTVETAFKETLASFPEETRPGLSIGTAFGSVQSIGDFLSESIVSGVNNVNPQLFANTVINAPTSNVNIRHLIRTLSATISTGFNAGLDALIYSRDFLLMGYLDSIIAGGVEEISYYALAGLQRSAVLSSTGRSRPFAVDTDGLVLGEGCGLVLLETIESARARGIDILAEVVGTGVTFDPVVYGGFNPSAEGAIAAVQGACAMAGIALSEIGFVAASANGNPAGDAMEAKLLRELFPQTPVTAYKALTGECYGASGALNTVCALADLSSARITGTNIGYDALTGVNLVSETVSRQSNYVLINSFSCDGNCSCVILKHPG